MKSRKELIREYKRTPKQMGVYCIRNTANGKSFIGASRDIQARFNRHRMELKMKKEPVAALQSDWLEFSEAAFTFEVLDHLEPLEREAYDPTEDLKALAEMWIEKLRPYEPDGYHHQ